VQHGPSTPYPKGLQGWRVRRARGWSEQAGAPQGAPDKRIARTRCWVAQPERASHCAWLQWSHGLVYAPGYVSKMAPLDTSLALTNPAAGAVRQPPCS